VGAELAADDRRAGDDPGRRPLHVRGEGEVDAGDGVDQAGEDVLQRIGALQVLRQRDAQDAE